VDKDARHGVKSDAKTFTGYKGNTMKSEDGFVTNIKSHEQNRKIYTKADY
jgi:transposase